LSKYLLITGSYDEAIGCWAHGSELVDIGEERIMGHVVLTGIIEKEEGQLVSYCPELGVASCGDTIDETLDNLGDALQVYLDALEETGELRRVLHADELRAYFWRPPKPLAEKGNLSRIMDVKVGGKVGRNAACPCGSGKKYEKCCDG
jgi:predicted RNase H-like HicB family nuclease